VARSTAGHFLFVFGSAVAPRDKRGAGIPLLFMSSPSTVLFSCLPHVLYVSFLFFFVYFLPFLFSFFRARTWHKSLLEALGVEDEDSPTARVVLCCNT
jgi:hypothetical protein